MDAFFGVVVPESSQMRQMAHKVLEVTELHVHLLMPFEIFGEVCSVCSIRAIKGHARDHFDKVGQLMGVGKALILIGPLFHALFRFLGEGVIKQ